MEWMSEIISFLAGLGIGFTLKFYIDVRRKKITTTAVDGSFVQSGNVVGGDMAGGNINKVPKR